VIGFSSPPDEQEYKALNSCALDKPMVINSIIPIDFLNLRIKLSNLYKSFFELAIP
jgi:hypothetical protein